MDISVVITLLLLVIFGLVIYRAAIKKRPSTGGSESPPDLGPPSSDPAFPEGLEPRLPSESLSPEVNFSQMTVAQLKTYAKDNGIDLGGAKLKADILEVLKSA